MASQSEIDFIKLKEFLKWTCEVDPSYRGLERDFWADKMVEEVDVKFGRSKAIKSLQLGVRDVVQKLDKIQGDLLIECDQLLASRKATTLSEIRILFGQDLKKIEKRGLIKTDDEFYLLRNAVEMPLIENDPPRQAKLRMMLADFEFGPNAGDSKKP
jgi:hypothetical protein